MTYNVDKNDIDSIEWSLDEVYKALDKWVKDYKKEDNLTKREKDYIFRILMLVGPTFAALDQLRDIKKSSTLNTFDLNNVTVSDTTSINIGSFTDFYKLSTRECELWTPSNQ